MTDTAPGGQPPATDPATPPTGDQPPVTPPSADPAPPQPPAGWTPPTYADWEAQQKAVAAANKRAKSLEDAAAKAEQQKAAEAGQFKELYESEQQKAERLQQGIVSAAVRSEVVAAAQRLGFQNPMIAAQLISMDGLSADLGDDFTASVDAASKTTIEQRLQERLNADPYLKGAPPRGQLPGAGDTPPATGNGGNAGFNAQLRQQIRG